MYSFLATYRWAYGSSQSAWSKGRQPSGAVLHSSHEPGELSALRMTLSHDDSSSTINIVLVIIIIINITFM